MNRQPIFNAVRTMLGRGFTDDEVKALDAAIDAAGGALLPPVEAERLTVSDAALNLIKSFEGCKLSAYPDPGTGGDPWTIGWGSTGPGIKKGVTWTQSQADERFRDDVGKFAQGVLANIGAAPTSQFQLDAMTSLAYNIGIGAFAKSTLLQKHKASDYRGAAGEFAKWNKAGGRVMVGLTRRREAEAAMYRGEA